jgi:P4 family phage/plasmid primase-like protien
MPHSLIRQQPDQIHAIQSAEIVASLAPLGAKSLAMAGFRTWNTRLHFYDQEFYSYRDGVYRVVPNATIEKVIRLEAERIAEDEAIATNKPARSVTARLVADAIAALRSYCLLQGPMPQWVGPVDAGTDPSEYLNGTDGLLDANEDLVHMALLPHTDQWFSSIQLPYPIGFVEHDSDPDEEYVEYLQLCPKWEAFLDQMLEGDSDRIALLQEWFGYNLSASTHLQRMLLMLGQGANGKSVVLHVLRQLVGPANVSAVPLDVLFSRFQLTHTRGKLVNIVTEHGDAAVDEQRLKAYVDGSVMYSDRKGLPGVEFLPTAKLIIAANQFPGFSDTSNGIWRRLLIIPFNVTIDPSQQNPFLAESLEEELSGIFHWALLGRDRLRTRLRCYGSVPTDMDTRSCQPNFPFTDSVSGQDALARYRGLADPVGSFLRDYQAGDGVIDKDVLYAAFLEWCADRDITHPASPGRISQRIAQTFPASSEERVRVAGLRVRRYTGLVKGGQV